MGGGAGQGREGKGGVGLSEGVGERGWSQRASVEWDWMRGMNEDSMSQASALEYVV